VSFELTKQELEELNEIFFGLMADDAFGNMLVKLQHEYEEPVSCYKLPLFLYNAGSLLRWVAASILALMGNHRISKLAKLMRPRK
jgi:hypothetical protein